MLRVNGARRTPKMIRSLPAGLTTFASLDERTGYVSSIGSFLDMGDSTEQFLTGRRKSVNRRVFLARTGLIGASALAGCAGTRPATGDGTSSNIPSASIAVTSVPPTPVAANPLPSSTQAPHAADVQQMAPAVHVSQQDVENWETVREQFTLTRDVIHMSSFYLASHPQSVRDAIEAHRRGLDENPIGYHVANNSRCERAVREAAAAYLGVHADEIALTDSTTMGLGLLYAGLKLRHDQEMLTTVHDHYATSASLHLRAEKTGTALRSIPLYRNLATVSKEEIVETLVKEIRPQTRVVAITWVHSSTGLKLPIREIAEALAQINADRGPAERALLCVDGVHGLGVEDIHLAELGCDFFVAGCHKWLFGPRGTGLVWGRPEGWSEVSATIPSFSGNAPFGPAMTPGGFHSFEHRWALNAAFHFHLAIGKSRVAERIHALNRQLKEGLVKLPHVNLHTPVADDLSAGIVCFEVDGLSPNDVVERLRERKIIASVTPYATQYVRLAPSLLTMPEDVEQTLSEVAKLNGS